jgi:hypothetical protein
MLVIGLFIKVVRRSNRLLIMVFILTFNLWFFIIGLTCTLLIFLLGS